MTAPELAARAPDHRLLANRLFSTNTPLFAGSGTTSPPSVVILETWPSLARAPAPSTCATTSHRLSVADASTGDPSERRSGAAPHRGGRGSPAHGRTDRVGRRACLGEAPVADRRRGVRLRAGLAQRRPIRATCTSDPPSVREGIGSAISIWSGWAPYSSTR